MILALSIVIVIGTILLGAKLWRMGGDGQKWARAVAFPSLLAVSKIVLLSINLTWSWWFLAVLLYMPALWGLMAAFSYGISAPPHKVWVWIIGMWTGKYNNPAWRGMADAGQIPAVEVATRCTCGFFWSLAAGIFAFVTGAWILFAIYVIFLTVANGVQWLLFNDVEVSEKVVGGCVATSVIV